MIRPTTLHLFLTAGASALPAMGHAKPPLERVPRAVEIAPIAVAKVKRIGDRIVLDGGWIPYTGGAGARSAKINAPFFDCYGRRPALTQDCTPGTGCVPSCDTAPDNGDRWYFGSAYHNPNTIEDMHDCACPPGSVISQIDLAFFWAPPSPSPCNIIYLPYEEVLNVDIGSFCDDVFTDTGGGGLALDFGVLPASTPSYYFSCPSGLEAFGVLSPSTDDQGGGPADGSYQQIIAHSVTSTGIAIAPGPCQPMLWGAANNGTGPADCRPGYNNDDAYDDDNPTDGVFSNPTECYSYVFTVCPDPLGKANCFSYLRCPADFNNDGFVDGIDADSFNNTFEAVPGSTQSCADLNGDCFVDGIDADMFASEFESACP